jgi:hypothetical protein
MRQRRQSPHEARIERELDWWAVCMIGYTERVPRSFGKAALGGGLDTHTPINARSPAASTSASSWEGNRWP